MNSYHNSDNKSEPFYHFNQDNNQNNTNNNTQQYIGLSSNLRESPVSNLSQTFNSNLNIIHQPSQQNHLLLPISQFEYNNINQASIHITLQINNSNDPTSHNTQPITYLNDQMHLNPNDLPIDVDSFVANLPNLEELDPIDQTSNHNQNQILIISNDHQSNNQYTNLYSSEHNDHNFNSFSQNHQNQTLIDIQSNQSHQPNTINQQQQQQQQNGHSQNYSLIRLDSNSETYFSNRPQSEIKMSNVDILNQVILSASNSSALSSTSSASNLSSSYLTLTPSSYSSSSSSSLIIDQSTLSYLNNLNHSPQNKRKRNPNSKSQKTKYVKNRKDEKICCNVCGTESSGYHYGSYTCEACKLFFRRTQKQIRKTGFNECKTKNCRITQENRSICSECRFKKCIAVGMAMNRSRFGRQTVTHSSNYASNLNETLRSLIDEIINFFKKHQFNFNTLNNFVCDFYDKTVRVLTSNDQTEQEIPRINFSVQATSTILPDSPLSEFSYLISSSKLASENLNQNTKLPDCVLVLFCVLFGIQLNTMDNKMRRIISDTKEFLQLIEEKVLKKNQFVLILKIGVYFKILRHLFEKNPVINDPCDKKITDLMRSEFAVFKFDAPPNMNESGSNSDLTSTTQLDLNQWNNLAELFYDLNEFLYKNMTLDELVRFNSIL